MRIGTGFDVHAFGDGDHVVLGGVRIAHARGLVAHSDGDSACAVDENVGEAGREHLRLALRRYFPEADGVAVALETCLFTNSPDEHFVIDLLDVEPRVVVAAGFSGHGFKFAPVIGEILADLATTGESRHPIECFRLQRFAAGA